MKKNLLNRMAILMIAIVGIVLVSCGDSGDETNGTVPGNTSEEKSNFQVHTGDATDVTEDGATLSATFSLSQRKPDCIGFLLGTSNNLTSTNRERDLKIFDITSSFSISVEGLQPHTTYYYRAYVYVENEDKYFYGAVESFTTGDSSENNNGNDASAKGSGTKSNPYNVTAIIAIANSLNSGEIDATDYYFKGRVSEIVHDFTSALYDKSGTASFYISDNDNQKGQFLCEEVKYLHNEGFWGGKQVSLGDEVVICGKITKTTSYVGTSSERAYVYSLNGDTGTTEAIDYYIDGRKFQTILVEGGPMEPFYIMQTELPYNVDITINNRVITPMDTNGDGTVISTELSGLLSSLRKTTNIPFRLPTKEEWQYAARGGSKSHNYTYSGSNNIDDVAWYKGNSDNHVHDIALKHPNELGLYDMSGNYAELLINGPCYSSDPNGEQCGGSWKHEASGCNVYSWEPGVIRGTVGHGTSEKICFDHHITVRLVYTKR